MSGGGGVSGEVGWPDYYEELHKHIQAHSVSLTTGDELTYSLHDLVNVAAGSGGNPYDGDTAYDPATPLSNIATRFGTTQTIIDALSPATDWNTFALQAVARYNSFEDITFLSDLAATVAGLIGAIEVALADSNVADMVDAFELNKKTRFLKEIGLWSGGMADINAVHTSSFIIGLSLQQAIFSNEIDAYDAQLRGDIYTTIMKEAIAGYARAQVVRTGSKDALLLNGPSIMANMQQYGAQLRESLTQIKADVERLTMIALKEQTDRQLQIDVDEAMWDLEVTMYAVNGMSSIAGAGVSRKANQMTPAQSALGGALAGASVGATFGPIGAGIGAAAGGLLGWALN